MNHGATLRVNAKSRSGLVEQRTFEKWKHNKQAPDTFTVNLIRTIAINDHATTVTRSRVVGH